MALSLYEVTVPAFAQIMEAMAGVLKKGEAHAIEKGMRPDDWVGARLFADMAPLSFQVKQAAHHSVGAIEATRKGVFSPDLTPPPETFADLQATVADALATLAAYRPADINALEGRDMRPLEYACCGFFASFAATFELPALSFVAALAVPLLVARTRSTVLYFLPAALIPLAALVACNYAAMGKVLPAYSEFGGPWYNFEGSHWSKVGTPAAKGIDFNTEPTTIYAFHLAFGHHGWFSLTPVWWRSR
jgi:hypothetical protein